MEPSKSRGDLIWRPWRPGGFLSFNAFFRSLLGVVLSTACVVACSPSEAATPEDDASQEGSPPSDAGPACLFCRDVVDNGPLSERVKGEIDRVCSNVDGCHGSGAGQLSLGIGSEFTPLIDVHSYEMPSMFLVFPGHPDESYVYKKIACDGGFEGGCMPPSSRFDPTLPPLFYEWIEAGAPTE